MHRLRMYRQRRRLVRRRMRVHSSNIDRLPAMYRYEDECCSEASIARHNDNVTSLCTITNNTFFKNKEVEAVIRAVNRNHFLFNTGIKLNSPYFDNNIEVNLEAGEHVCFGPLRELDSVNNYSRILENLKLSKGDSFLHLGSGTGYLNTLAGLIIGATGINHGVEIQEAMVNYAEERQEAFKDHCKNLQKFEYCEPVFIQGDCLKLSLETRYYDRIYCSGILPEGYDFFLRIYLKPGGLLMYPQDSKTFTKISLGLYNRYMTEEESLISDLKVYPFQTEKSGNLTQLPEKVFPTLQELARSAVRIKIRSTLPEQEETASAPEPAPADPFRGAVFGGRVMNNDMNVEGPSSDDESGEEFPEERDIAEALEHENLRAFQRAVQRPRPIEVIEPQQRRFVSNSYIPAAFVGNSVQNFEYRSPLLNATPPRPEPNSIFIRNEEVVQNNDINIDFVNFLYVAPNIAGSAPQIQIRAPQIRTVEHIENDEYLRSSSSSDSENETPDSALRRQRHIAALNRHSTREITRANIAHVPYHNRHYDHDAGDPEIDIGPEVLEESSEEDNVMYTIARNVCRKCMMVKNDKIPRGPSKLNPNAPDDPESLNGLINFLPLPKPLKTYLKYKRTIVAS